MHLILPYVAAAACALAVLAMAGGIFYAAWDQSGTNAALCRQTVSNRDADRLTWDSARALILMGQFDKEARDRTNHFFDSVLLKIPALECVGNQPVPKED